MASPPERARAAGQHAVASFRRRLAERVAEALKRDPDRMGTAVELGLVRREWLENPAEEAVSTTSTAEVLHRFMERSVEQRPSFLAAVGLSAMQILSSLRDDDHPDGVPARLAVAFTDLEGFTAYTAREGDEVASHLLTEHHRVAAPLVRARGGRIVKRLGDGLLLTFPEPEAAVLACLELVDHAPGPLELRAGIHVGEVHVTRDDVIGHVVNAAFRVADSARGGSVLVTGDVREAVKDLPTVQFGRARRRVFKGLGEPLTVCRVTWVGHPRPS